MSLCLGVYVNERSDLFRSAVSLIRGGHELFVAQDFGDGFHRMFFVYAVVGKSSAGAAVHMRTSMPFSTRFEAEAQLVKIFDCARSSWPNP